MKLNRQAYGESEKGRKSRDGADRKPEGKYFIRPKKRMEDFPPNGEGYVDYVLKNLIQKPYKI